MHPERGSVKIGLNYLGDIVLFCVDCHLTFAKKLQDKTMVEVDTIIAEHTHTQADLDFLKAVREEA